MKMKHILSRLLLLAAFLPLAAWGEKQPTVLLHTSVGDITVTLFNSTPAHRDNFLKLVHEGYYDGVIFHRVIKNFMIQTGDPDSRNPIPYKVYGDGGPDYTLPLELDLPRHYHYRGALAAARESDDVNPERRSSGSQFYIVWGKRYSEADLSDISERIYEATDGRCEITKEMAETYGKKGGTPWLDGQYTVFGEVTIGLDVVKAIQNVSTDTSDRPLKDIFLLKATVVE